MKSYELENKSAANDTAATLKRWLENRNAGKTFADYFREYGCHTIAIFDAGELGRLLYDELKDSEIEVRYFVDRNAEGIGEIDNIPVVMIKELGDMPEVDIIAVSPVYNYEEVLKLLIGINKEIRTIAFKEAVYEF